jgi:hypothetical protein
MALEGGNRPPPWFRAPDYNLRMRFRSIPSYQGTDGSPAGFTKNNKSSESLTALRFAQL